MADARVNTRRDGTAATAHAQQRGGGTARGARDVGARILGAGGAFGRRARAAAAVAAHHRISDHGVRRRAGVARPRASRRNRRAECLLDGCACADRVRRGQRGQAHRAARRAHGDAAHRRRRDRHPLRRCCARRPHRQPVVSPDGPSAVPRCRHRGTRPRGCGGGVVAHVDVGSHDRRGGFSSRAVRANDSQCQRRPGRRRGPPDGAAPRARSIPRERGRRHTGDGGRRGAAARGVARRGRLARRCDCAVRQSRPPPVPGAGPRGGGVRRGSGCPVDWVRSGLDRARGRLHARECIPARG